MASHLAQLASQLDSHWRKPVRSHSLLFLAHLNSLSLAFLALVALRSLESQLHRF
jgi:hypothetical protein